MTQALLRAWTHRGAQAWLLWPMSLLYGLLIRIRRWLYRATWLTAERLPVPVIIVGNVVVGGAGKTPVVIALVNHLQARGVRVGVISRGYGRPSDQTALVDAQSDPLTAGDEPVLIARKTGAPVCVGQRRADAAKRLLQAFPDTRIIVSDDGLQHLALHRDLQICVFDDRGIGNGFLLPAGPLREPWPMPVDLVLNTGLHPTMPGESATRSLADHAVRADGTQRALSLFRNEPVTAIAGIATPEAFFGMLRNCGLTLSHTDARPDHDDFRNWQPPVNGPATLLCTEKDAVKLWQHHPQAWAVPLVVNLPPATLAEIDSLLASAKL